MRFDFARLSTQALIDLAIHVIEQPFDEGRDVMFDAVLTVLLDRFDLAEYQRRIHPIEMSRPVNPFSEA
jgi:hypothetical protein